MDTKEKTIFTQDRASLTYNKSILIFFHFIIITVNIVIRLIGAQKMIKTRSTRTTEALLSKIS